MERVSGRLVALVALAASPAVRPGATRTGDLSDVTGVLVVAHGGDACSNAHVEGAFATRAGDAASRALDRCAPSDAAINLRDAHLAERPARGVEACAALDNLTYSRDPSVGLLDSKSQPLAIRRAEAGRNVHRCEWGHT